MVRSARLCSVAFALALLIGSHLPTQASGCANIRGRHVILASDAINPNVFLWDRRALMVSYAAGFWQPTDAILDHTRLEKPGTRGYVIACQPHQVHIRYSIVSHDAIGLKILSGLDAGRYGWSLEDDVHSLR